MRVKKASKDFSINDLPSNRKEVFFDCFKVRWSTLLKGGFLAFVFAIPYIVLLLSEDLNISRLYQELSNGAISEEEFISSKLSVLLVSNILKTIASIFLSLGLAGLTRLIRQIAWEEPIFFRKDFFDGIRLNGGSFIIIILFLSLIFNVANFTQTALYQQRFLSSIPFGIGLIIVFPIALYNMASVNVYSNGFFTHTKNSILFFLRTVPVSALFILIFCISFLPNLISNALIKYLIIVLMYIILLPYYYLAFFLYASYNFDKYVNKKLYPEIYDKGIVRKDTLKAKGVSTDDLNEECNHNSKTK